MKKLLKKHFSFIIAVLMVISLIIIPRTAQAASVKLNKTKLTMNVGGLSPQGKRDKQKSYLVQH